VVLVATRNITDVNVNSICAILVIYISYNVSLGCFVHFRYTDFGVSGDGRGKGGSGSESGNGINAQGRDGCIRRRYSPLKTINWCLKIRESSDSPLAAMLKP
jgi:hypothetical protein